MGKSGSKVSVATLNYSGIYLNPFEYYAVDNWEELQAIGRVFQRNLKRDYQHIKDTLAKQYTQASKDSNDGNKKVQQGAFSAQNYSRTSFAWDVGDIDKYIHNDRYSPLYSQSDRPNTDIYPGIVNGKFLTEEQYINTWMTGFKKLEDRRETEAMREVAKQAKKAKLDQRYQCAMLDFMCYQAIVEHLYNKLVQEDEQSILQNNNLSEQDRQAKIHEVVSRSFDLKDIEQYIHKETLKQRYQQFMVKSFKRIDVQDKIKTTIDHLFLKNSIDIVTLPEATAELRSQLEKLEDYYVYGPSEKQRTKQTLMIIRRKCVLIPAGYSHTEYLRANQLLLNVREDAGRIIDSSDTPTILKDLRSLFESRQFLQYLKNNHIDRIFEGYAERLYKYSNSDKKETNQEMKLQNDRKKIRELVENLMQKLEGPFKMRLEAEIVNSQYWKQMLDYFYQYWLNRIAGMTGKSASNGKQYKAYIDDLKQKGLFSWMMDVTLVQFPQQRLVIGGFHLPSKAIKNDVVVTIMGILLYFLSQSQNNFIFSGDFNSYISLLDKDDINGVFHFVESYLEIKQKKIDAKFSTKWVDSGKIGIYPRHPKMITTKKKRTIMQPQVKKVNELKELCIDQILSSLKFHHEESHIGEIGEVGTDKMSAKHFLPHSKHPYDHFLVYTHLALPQLPPN